MTRKPVRWLVALAIFWATLTEAQVRRIRDNMKFLEQLLQGLNAKN
jgi:hypothetical protein